MFSGGADDVSGTITPFLGSVLIQGVSTVTIEEFPDPDSCTVLNNYSVIRIHPAPPVGPVWHEAVPELAFSAIHLQNVASKVHSDSILQPIPAGFPAGNYKVV